MQRAFEFTPRWRVVLVLVLLLAATVAAQPPAPRGPVLKTKLGEIEISPTDNPWNQDISKPKVHTRSRAWIESMGADKPLSPCFGADYMGAPNGILYVVVEGNAPKQFVEFEYPDESEKGPYPIPKNPPIEGAKRSAGQRSAHRRIVGSTTNCTRSNGSKVATSNALTPVSCVSSNRRFGSIRLRLFLDPSNANPSQPQLLGNDTLDDDFSIVEMLF